MRDVHVLTAAAALLIAPAALHTLGGHHPAPEPARPVQAASEPPRPAAHPDGWQDRHVRWDAARRAIIRCESGGDPQAKNPRSTASGVFQFLDGTWTWVTGLPAPARAHPPAVQHRAFWALWDKGAGASHWAASAACWWPEAGWAAAP